MAEGRVRPSVPARSHMDLRLLVPQRRIRGHGVHILRLKLLAGALHFRLPLRPKRKGKPSLRRINWQLINGCFRYGRSTASS